MLWGGYFPSRHDGGGGGRGPTWFPPCKVFFLNFRSRNGGSSCASRHGGSRVGCLWSGLYGCAFLFFFSLTNFSSFFLSKHFNSICYAMFTLYAILRYLYAIYAIFTPLICNWCKNRCQFQWQLFFFKNVKYGCRKKTNIVLSGVCRNIDFSNGADFCEKTLPPPSLQRSRMLPLDSFKASCAVGSYGVRVLCEIPTKYTYAIIWYNC